MNAFLRKVATVCVAFLLCASMGTIAFANDLPIYSEWAKAEVSAAENEGLLPFEMYHGPIKLFCDKRRRRFPHHFIACARKG